MQNFPAELLRFAVWVAMPRRTILLAIQATALLAALTRPNHIVYLCSWGSLICRLHVI